MAFNYAAKGDGWRLAGSLVRLAEEIKSALPWATCLGTIGDQTHVAEGSSSDHNPFVKDPHSGLGIVRAIDIGGPDAKLKELRRHLWDLYAARDDRVFRYGYMKGCSDNQINNWGLPFGTHTDTGDAGHLHVSVTQADGNNPGADGYLAAIDDKRSWGIGKARPHPGHVGTPPPGPYPFHAPDHFGDIDGGRHSHGGDPRFDDAAVIAGVRWIQTRLNELGFGPLTVDGRFTASTISAVSAFQRRFRPGPLTTLPGQVWADDWHTLTVAGRDPLP